MALTFPGDGDYVMSRAMMQREDEWFDFERDGPQGKNFSQLLYFKPDRALNIRHTCPKGAANAPSATSKWGEGRG